MHLQLAVQSVCLSVSMYLNIILVMRLLVLAFFAVTNRNWSSSGDRERERERVTRQCFSKVTRHVHCCKDEICDGCVTESMLTFGISFSFYHRVCEH